MTDPYCELCELRGELVDAAEVDHIRRIEDGGQRYAWGNLQSLCKSCHAKKSASERGEKGYSDDELVPNQFYQK